MLLLFAAINDTEDWNVTGAGEGAEEGTSAWDDMAVDMLWLTGYAYGDGF